MSKLLGNIRQTNISSVMFILLAMLLLGGCATEHVIIENAQVTDQDALLVEQEQDKTDPYERFNRSMFGFNEVVDTYVADPITTAYKWVFPQFIQTGVSNFYTNLAGINVVLNDLLQGKFKQSGLDSGRFLLNSTVGLAGIIDVATYAGLDQNNEDFDQTLAVWGVPTGPYLVLPFLGPGTFRAIPGAVVDAAANPVTYAPWGFAAVAALNKRANAEGALKFIDEAALDPYVFTRESYLQWREHQASDGNAELSDDLKDLDEEFFDDYEDETSVDVSGQDDSVESSSKIDQEGGISGAVATTEQQHSKQPELDAENAEAQQSVTSDNLTYNGIEGNSTAAAGKDKGAAEAESELHTQITE